MMKELFPKTLITAGACVAMTTLLNAADWPQYRGPNLDGSTSEKISVNWPKDGPKALWRVPAPAGFSSFTVAGGKAYTLVKRMADGAEQEVVLALDASTGKEVWGTPLGVSKYDGGGDAGTNDNKGGDGPRSSVTIEGNRAYAFSCNLVVVCIDAASGKVLWKRDLIGQHAGKNIQWKNAASPVVDGDLVFVGGGGPGQALMALNKASGEVVWKGQDDTITHSTPVVGNIHGVRQVIFFTKTGLVALEVKKGTVLWRHAFPFKVSTAITPIIAGDVVYCSAGYGVGSTAVKVSKAGSAFSAKEMWFSAGNQPVANHWSTPVYKDGHLYGMFQFKEYGSGPLKCVELATGKVKWEKAGYGPGNVILVGGQVLALSDAGELVVVEATPSAYKELSRAKVLSGKCWSTPVVSNGRVYARSTKEAVCLDVSGKSASR